MADLSPSLRGALADRTEYDEATSHLSALLQSYPPPFIFVHDPENPRLTATSISSALRTLASEPDDLVQLRYACVNAVSCFSARIFFDTALNALAGWTPDWQGGAQNWLGPAGAEGRRYNENFDAFVHGVQAVYTDATVAMGRMNDVGKGKGRASDHAGPTPRMVLMVERAERLKDNLPELVVPLTRLSELVRLALLARRTPADRCHVESQAHIDIVTVFISDVQWQDIRPPLRSSPEPYYIDVSPLSKQGELVRHFGG